MPDELNNNENKGSSQFGRFLDKYQELELSSRFSQCWFSGVKQMAATLTNSKEKIRLNLDISAKVNDNLNALKERTGSVSVAEAVRKAIALLDLVITHIEENGTVVLRYRDGHEEQLRFL
jgi:hypothetical protein